MENENMNADVVGSQPVSPVTPSAPTPEQVEQQTPAPSQTPDIETRIESRFVEMERKHQEELATLRTQLEEEQRRTRQSLRDVGDSIVQRVQERFGTETRIVDEWEQSGKITPEEATSERLKVRNRIEREETQRYREQAVQSQREFAERERQRVIQTCSAALQSSGLVETDPEFKSVPLEIPVMPPDEAIKFFTGKLEAAKLQKATRVAAGGKKTVPAPSSNGVFVDLGGSSPQPPSTGLAHKTASDAYDDEWKDILAKGGRRTKRS